MDNYPEYIVKAIRERKPFKNPQLIGSRTVGGTYLLSIPQMSGRRDIMAITPYGDIVKLSPFVDTTAIENAML